MFFDGDNPLIEFDNLCGCGDPECPVGRAAAIAKKLYNGEAVTAYEGRELGEAFAQIVLMSKAMSLQLRLASATLQAFALGADADGLPQPPTPTQAQPRQPRRNPFSAN